MINNLATIKNKTSGIAVYKNVFLINSEVLFISNVFLF